MPLKKAKGNMYGFITHTWNFIRGVCSHNCGYCYMQRWWSRMSAPRLDEEEFKVNPGSGKDIFIGSGIDMLAPGIPRGWVVRVLEYLQYFDNTYLLQSKNPEMFFRSIYPQKTILCTTIETNRVPTKKILGNCCTPEKRMLDFLGINHNQKMVTIEPVMDFDLLKMIEWMCSINPMQINIGADSGGNNLPEPPKEKLLELIYWLQNLGLNVHQKPNLRRLLK